MKKFIAVIFLMLSCFGNYNFQIAHAESGKVVYSVNDSILIKQIEDFTKKFNYALNKHDIKKLKEIYSPDYLDEDGFNADSVSKLTEDIWKNYPDIKYLVEIKNIRINETNATIEFKETAVAKTSKNSDITDDKGELKSISQNIVYLKKYGKDWKITSDKINYEYTSIFYGIAKNINIKFFAPEQVSAGEDYTASININIPQGVYVLGSIAKEEIIYPNNKAEEIFREISSENSVLERLLKANKSNNNEVATASIGLTEVVPDKKAKPEVKITGIAILSQRVNVIPAKKEVVNVNNQTKTSSGL